MTEQEIRTFIAEALDQAGVIAMRDKKLTPILLEGRHDIPFDILDLDSLAVMELCIAIEVNTGISILPDQLKSIGTLNRLVDMIREGLA